MWRPSRLKLIEITKQSACGSDAGAISCFDSESFKRAYPKTID
jgi:hypothetical protein